ncbi:MAG: long-chain fatty acid--CoA ligase [Phycisphaerales bacterium]|nr:long-chain fatty acid--CoA ligase [Phycisphaerales bacterium]
MKLLRTIQRQILMRPWRVAVVDDQRSWRAFELQVVAWHLAREIERVSSSERVGILLPTSGLFPAAVMAGWILGRTVVPLNYLLSKTDLEYVCADAGLDACVAVSPMIDLVGGLPKGVQAIRMDQMKFTGFPPVRFSRGRKADELALLLYTSGTSGRPKGVMLTAGNLMANIEQIVDRAKFNRTDTMLGVLPQFHTFGITVLTLLPLAIGCRAIYTARFIPRKLIDLTRKHRPTALVAIPSMYGALRLVKDATRDDLQSLRYVVSGGEPLPQAVSDSFLDRFGIRISEGYGLTETAPVTNWCLPQEWRWRSVGRPLARIDQRIVDSAGKDVALGEEGEIRVAGPNVMAGYWKLPAETQAAFDERGYFRTGDMGRFDADGHLFITGRIKEMLIIAGENVFPREIEEVLDRHPTVKASAVVGRPDDSRGELPIAFVELRDGANLDEGQLRAWCREHLAQFKVPREIKQLDALPRNPTGKIQRRALLALLSSDTDPSQPESP